MTNSSNLLVGPIRPLTGAASSSATGEEATLVDSFLARRTKQAYRRLFLTEVPLPGGVADLVEVKLLSPFTPTGGEAMHALAVLAHVEDRLLYGLARLDVGRRYRIGGEALRGLSRTDLSEAVGMGLLEESEAGVARPRQLPDIIDSTDIYEFKSRLDRRSVTQAAARRHLATRTWVVGSGTIASVDEIRKLAELHGIGVVDAESGVRIAAATERPRPPRWARFEIARQVARGTYGGPKAKSR